MAYFDLVVGTGAAVVMGAMYLWLARHDIKEIFSKASSDKQGDGLNHRLLISAALISIVFISIFEMVLLKKGPIQFIVRIIIWLLVMVEVVRIRSEAIRTPYAF